MRLSVPSFSRAGPTSISSSAPVVLDAQVRASVLPDLYGLDPSAQRERHELHPVADTEHRHFEVEERRVHPWRPVLVDGVRPAGEDDALGLASLYLLYRGVVGDELREHPRLAHAAGY